jgi:hypothetical protein
MDTNKFAEQILLWTAPYQISSKPNQWSLRRNSKTDERHFALCTHILHYVRYDLLPAGTKLTIRSLCVKSGVVPEFLTGLNFDLNKQSLNTACDPAVTAYISVKENVSVD